MERKTWTDKKMEGKPWTDEELELLKDVKKGRKDWVQTSAQLEGEHTPGACKAKWANNC